jgi:hypothetical protein
MLLGFAGLAFARRRRMKRSALSFA